MGFSTVIGQDRAVSQLKAMLKNRRVPPGLLFTGPHGCGKGYAALRFARALNCLDDGAVARQDCCAACQNCLHIAKGIHPDVIVCDYAFQARLTGKEESRQEHILIDTVRELIIKAQQKAMAGRWKVYIIDRADTMTNEAANALLKLLEEPPEGTLWILLAEKREALPETIRSRCQTVAFNPLSEEAVAEILVERGMTLEEAQKLAQVSEGSVEQAEKAGAISAQLSELDRLDPMFPFKAGKILPKEGALARDAASSMIEMLAENARRRWRQEANPQSRDRLALLIDELFQCLEYLRRNVSPANVLALAIMKAEPHRIPLFPES